MNNKPYLQLMAAFAAVAAIVSVYASIWYGCREIYGISALWGALAVDMFIRVNYFVTRSKQ